MKHNAKRSTTIVATSALFTATILAGTSGAALAAPEDLPEPALLYTFNESDDDTIITDEVGDYDGELVGEGAEFTSDGLKLPGGSSDSDAASIEVPTEVFAGQETVTVSAWLENDTGNGNYAAAYVGGEERNNGYWLFNPANPDGKIKSVLTTATADNPQSETWDTEIGSQNPGRSATSGKTLYTTVIDGENGALEVYVNGVLVSSDEVSTSLADYGDADQMRADIGRSAYDDQFFEGTINQYRVDHAALTNTEVKDLFEDGGGDIEEVIDEAKSVVDVPEEATSDFKLPASAQGLNVQWEVLDGDAIEVSDDTAVVTRPGADSDDAEVILQATFLEGEEELSAQDFLVLVRADLNDAQVVESDADALEIENADDIRTNFSVPSIGENGSEIQWSVVSGPVTAEGEDDDDSITMNVDRPAAGGEKASAQLEATVSAGDETAIRSFDVTITPMPDGDEDMEAYFWAFFTGEGQGAEKVSFAASQGNDALAWNTLNDGTPVIESDKGTKGLRDPFIIRSEEGDKFFMIATDLKIDGLEGGFDTAQKSGSRYLEIWESTDLVNWGEQRHVEVSSEYAGNTWAPEAFYDDEIGKYVVYWASNLYEDIDPDSRDQVTYNRMMYSLTEDFVSFTEPEVWIDVDQGQGYGTIDVTAAKEGDWYYRVYKDESDMTLREEKSKTFLATHNGEDELPKTHDDENKWSLIGEEFASGLDNGAGNEFHQGEGPTFFPSNPKDVNGYDWFVWIDQPDYHDGPNHYVPFATDQSLADTEIDDWESVADDLIDHLPENADGGKPRHGTVIPITRAEYQGVLENYQPDIAVESVEAIDVETEVDVAPDLPADVELTMVEGESQEAGVEWDEIPTEALSSPGTFTVSGTADDDSRIPVEATVTVVEADDGDGQEGSDQDGADQDGADETGGETPGDDDSGDGQDAAGSDSDDADGQDAAGVGEGSLPRTGYSPLLALSAALVLGGLGLAVARFSKRKFG